MASTPVWYELMCRDWPAQQAFYGAIMGWQFGDAPVPEGSPAYHFMRYDDSPTGAVGGAMELTADMIAGGAKPMWAVYFAVPDPDATAARAEELGASVLMAPFDLEGIGRMAFLADPQGAPFYIMRGFSEEQSAVYSEDSTAFGQCGWNELMAADLEPALAFYRDLLGFTTDERMPMGPEYGDYVFIDSGSARLGAAMKAMEGTPTGWRFYFRVPEIEAAKQAVEAGGGTVFMGPAEVPGDEMIIVAADPEGVPFGLVAPKGA